MSESVRPEAAARSGGTVGEQAAAALLLNSHLGWTVGLFSRRPGFQQTPSDHPEARWLSR